VRNRPMPSAVPSPAALFSVAAVRVPGGREACFGDAAIEQHSQQALFTVRTGRPQGPPLELTARAPGWSQDVPVPGGYGDGATVSVPLRPPSAPVLARVCIRNRGGRAIALSASDDRTRSRSIAEVGGRSQRKSIWFALFERRPTSFARRMPTVLERVTAFRPGLIGVWLLWPLLGAVVLGVPAALVWAYVAAVREDEPEA
jgi:hypothetical protein